MSALPGNIAAPGVMVTSDPPLRQRERWALALLALSGCAFLPLALDRFVFPKLVVAALGVLAATTVAPRGRLPRAAVAICCAGALLLLGGALAGATPLAQLLGRPPRYEGAFVLALYLGVFAAGARLMGSARAMGATSWWLRWLALAALAIGVEAVLESAGLRPLASDVARPGSLLGNASDEGAWAVLALGPLASVALRVGGRLRIAGALAATVVVVCSGSRGALLGVAATALVLILLTPRRGVRVLLALSLVVVAIGVLTLPQTSSRVLGSSPLAGHTTRGRELLWGETLKLIADKPLLGVGPSGYLDAIPAYHDSNYERRVGPQNPPESPHNVVLQATASGGLLLALLAVALATLVARGGLVRRRVQATGGEEAFVVGMLAGLAGYAVTLLFFFTTPGSTPLAVFMAGALLARPVGAERSVPARPVRAERSCQPTIRRAWQLALVALVVVFSAAAVAEIPLRSAITAAASDHLAGASDDFDLARDLRPWDGGVAAIAAHAYAQLTRAGIRSAADAGAPWSSRALGAYPNWVQVLADGATITAARGDSQLAKQLLGRAIARDPSNPELRQLLASLNAGA